VEEVSFNANETTLIGVDSTNPYSVTWNNVLEGTYSLTAIARDIPGESMTSDPVVIAVYTGECLIDEDCNDWNDCTVDTCVDGMCQNECGNTVTSYPYTEGFESGWGDWVNDSDDDIDWTRNSGSTPSRRTGPSGAHGGSYYIYTEASSPNYPDKTALLISPCFDLSNTTDAELTFWYHMYGSAMGTLNMEVSEDCENWTNVWSISGDQGNTWYQANVDLTPYIGTTITIRFTSVTGSSYRSDMSIDDVEVTVITEILCSGDEDCDDGDFCNGAETCVDDLCQAGTDPCPGQFCDEDIACMDCLVNGDCDDGLYCNGVESCVGGVCQPGSTVDCDDGIACTADSCNESSDSCDNVTNDAACDDGLFCNGDEICSATLGCQAGSDPCPGNYCDEVTDTCYECQDDSECDDGLFCTGTETCVSGACQFSSDPCPGQGCDEENDECVATPNDQMHVNTIEVTKQRSWWRRRGIAKVQIMDTEGSPVEGAIVTGQWSGGANDTDQVSTGSDGWVTIYSNWRWGDATFTFCVTNVSKEGWDYDPVITCGNTD
jgi:hypothetical protein